MFFMSILLIFPITQWLYVLTIVSDINECIDNDCVNGYCVDGVAGYTCNCYSGWHTEYCDGKLNSTIWGAD